MASACISLYLFITKLISMVLVFCVVFVTSASRRVNPHRFHNKLFHPAAAAVHSDHHRSRRGDCREDDWESLSFAGRIAQGDSDAIVQGRVERLMMWRNPSRSYQGTGIYTAEVTVNCVYKGWGYPDRLNISGFGETNDCVQTHVALGESYIFLLKDGWKEGQMQVNEYNDQVGVVEASRVAKSEAASVARCRGPEETTVEPSSYSFESSESQSADRYSNYESMVINYPSSSSGSSSGSSSEDECSDCSQSASTYDHSYYDYDKDGGVDFYKRKPGSLNCNGVRILFWFDKYEECNERNFLWFLMFLVLLVPITCIVVVCVCKKWDSITNFREDFVGRSRHKKKDNGKDYNFEVVPHTEWL